MKRMSYSTEIVSHSAISFSPRPLRLPPSDIRQWDESSFSPNSCAPLFFLSVPGALRLPRSDWRARLCLLHWKHVGLCCFLLLSVTGVFRLPHCEVRARCEVYFGGRLFAPSCVPFFWSFSGELRLLGLGVRAWDGPPFSVNCFASLCFFFVCLTG